MESLIALIKEITAPLANIFGQITRGEQNKTDRIINLLENTRSSVGDTLQEFLKQELHRKITSELKGVDLTQSQLKVIEDVISQSGNRIKWSHVKTARQYLYFEAEKLKIDFHALDHVFNWVGFIIGALLIFLGMAIAFMDYYTDIKEKNVYMILIQLIFFLFAAGFGGFIINGTSSYFAGRKIIKELKGKTDK